MSSRIRGAMIAGLSALVLGLGCSGAENISGPSVPSNPQNPPTQQQRPTLTISCPQETNENDHFDCQPQATGSNLTYSISGPSWMSINSSTGEITGIAPEVESDSNFNYAVTVANSGGSDYKSSNLTVKNVRNIYSLSSSQLIGLQVNDSSLSFSQPVDFAIGDVVYSGIDSAAPSGLLRQVTSVSQDKKTVSTKNPVLEDIVRDAAISSYNSLLPSQARSFNGLKGISRSASANNGFNFSLNLNNVVLYDADGNPATTDDQIIANGSISFNPGFSFDLSIKDFKLENLSIEQILNESSDITIGSNLLLMAGTYNVKIAEYDFPPIIVGTLPTFPPIPLIITPKIEVNAGINFTQSNPLSFRVKQDAILNGGIEYADNSWKPITRLLSTFDFSIPEVSGDWNLKAYAGPTLKLPLFDFAGGNIGAKLNMSLQASNGNWELHGGFDASAGVSAEIFSHVLASYSAQIINFDTLLAKGVQQPTQDSNFTDSRDGQIYKLVKIGNQTWMAQNLNFNNSGSEYYNNDASLSTFYGRLYDFSSSRSSCPSGWRLPTVSDWNTLSSYLGGNEVDGGKLKSTGTVEAGTGRWYFPNTGATNESGFSAQPGGQKINSAYYDEGYRAYFWAIDTDHPSYSDAEWFNYSSQGMNSFGSPLSAGYKFSVRCVKN